MPTGTEWQLVFDCNGSVNQSSNEQLSGKQIVQGRLLKVLFSYAFSF